ncbi:MAG: response regulator, partial [Deltaproteobacteria bacterium]
QAVQGYAELLLLQKTSDEPGYAELKEIVRAGKRGGDLTQQLLTFSRKVESKLRPVDLNHEVQSVIPLLERTIPKMIDIKLNLTEGLKIINADPGQMEHVLMNLGVNAKDAMPEGGQLIIETDNTTLDAEYCRSHAGAKPGDYVSIAVSDTGLGIDRETMEHIFEPFYTNKGAGKGTGLGLATVYGIVKSHAGYMTCHSETGKGTTFKIYLPVIRSVRETAELEEQTMALQLGKETILLVDDEESILNLGREILEQFGYTVLTATDGERGLELYRKEKSQIDLVVLDLFMPGMGGKKCLAQMLDSSSHVRALIASGDSSDAQIEQILQAGAKGFISKPYDVTWLLRAVRNVLDEN